MNENEAARIAAAIHHLRPDWPLASLRTLLARHELASKSRRDVAVALAWVACESETTTPARVIEAGPWWRAANVEHPDRTIRRPPQKHEECAAHEGEYRDFCRSCISDRKAAADLVANGPRLSVADAKAAVREAIAATDADLCSHGVPVERCAAHDPRRQKAGARAARAAGVATSEEDADV